MTKEKAKRLAGEWFRAHYPRAGRIWQFSHIVYRYGHWSLLAHGGGGYEVEIIVWDNGKVEHA